jgi:hypothetical protein
MKEFHESMGLILLIICLSIWKDYDYGLKDTCRVTTNILSIIDIDPLEKYVKESDIASIINTNVNNYADTFIHNAEYFQDRTPSGLWTDGKLLSYLYGHDTIKPLTKYINL